MYTKVKDVNNIIDDYKNQLEHTEKFSKTLEQIKNIEKIYTVETIYADSTSIQFENVFIEYKIKNKRRCFTNKKQILFNEKSITDIFALNYEEFLNKLEVETFYTREIFDLNNIYLGLTMSEDNIVIYEIYKDVGEEYLKPFIIHCEECNRLTRYFYECKCNNKCEKILCSFCQYKHEPNFSYYIIMSDSESEIDSDYEI